MEQTLVPGLEGVPATESRISFIDGKKGILQYRGYPIETLAMNSSFEETTYLLLWGMLPTQDKLNRFDQDLRRNRDVPDRVLDLLRCLPEKGHPMNALQSSAAALGTFFPARDLSNEEEKTLSAVRLIAKMSTLVAAFERLRRGKEPVGPRSDLNHGANFLWMMTGKEPDPLESKIIDVCLILHAEHTMNASTFTGLVTTSTLADPYAVITSAIGALSGPLHGGANEEVVALLQDIGSVEKVRPRIEKMIFAKQKIMGMGHRVYKVKDPRAPILQSLAEELFASKGESPLYQIAREVERVVAEHLGDKGIWPNVDFYSGIVYDQLGIPSDQFTSIFAISRVTGWLAHWLEQLQDNRLFRPSQIYRGEHDLSFVPLKER